MPDYWYCSACHSANQPYLDRCYACGQPRSTVDPGGSAASATSRVGPAAVPMAATPPSSSPAVTGVHGWTCAGCGLTNRTGALWCARCKESAAGAAYPPPPSGVLTLIRTYPGDKVAASQIYQQDAARLAQS